MSYDIFLKLGDIKGESSDEALAGTIELQSVSFGAANQFSPGSGGSMTAGRVALSELSFQKKYDSSSPLMFKHCAAGKIFPEATITFRRAAGDAGQEVFYVVTLTNVGISAINIGGAPNGDETPAESVSLAYTSIKNDYKAQKDDGSGEASIIGGWDAKLNKAI